MKNRYDNPFSAPLDLSENYLVDDVYLGEHKNCIDEVLDVIRIEDTRFKKIKIIQPELLLKRKIDSVTIDNFFMEGIWAEFK
ncbi:hypothetical protein BCR22_00365 [Enterococcus plantarum]|uniref:Uncharacterized protein n=1 Tax=Enterococcus plantarum TaxID=1077675 RepID=A0A2W4BCN0_9ENTE|nr:hypothetical protein [Enterococcus plantarum]MBO0421496.1 hypothetical protein [Enterococcus plantarum]OEG20900.1 hypothetical protein BCR22_00365 [Enterococcus plantarum]PZL70662.1 hypothetical protein CI088_14840 [Enterococcus plantarum]